MKVADYIADFIVKTGVRHVFGYQGGAILKLVEAMLDTGKIEYVQNYHEQASSFCADSYSRVSENLGIAMATSGPGATNLVTGITNAQLDSIPTLFITGQDFSARLIKKEGTRSNGFQDLDIVSIVKPITKYATTVTEPDRIRYELERALYEAKSGRPGAVLLDIPIDLQFKEVVPEELEGFTPQLPVSPSIEKQQIENFLSALKQATRPVILIGGGVRTANALNELNQFIDATNIPVAMTLNGLDSCEKAIGFSGLYGNTYTNLAVYHADLLIVLGARLGQHQVGKTKIEYTKGKVVHIDIDPTELERSFSEDISIQANIKDFLVTMNDVMKQGDIPSYDVWNKTIQDWKVKYINSHIPNEETLSPVGFVRHLVKKIDSDAILVSDVGQNQMWVAQGVDLKKSQRLLNSSGLGSMGYSLPAAIGAKICCPDRQVLSFMGDGGFQMNMQELQLISQRQLDIKIFVFNNQSLGLIGYTQNKHFNGRKPGFTAPDYYCGNIEKLTFAYDIPYFKVTSLADIALLDDVLKSKGPCLVELVIPQDAKLYNRNEEFTLISTESLNG